MIAAPAGDIAVIGTACRFPGAADPDAFIGNLRAGTSGIRPLPPDRWPIDEMFDPDPRVHGKIYARDAGTIDGVDRFDRRHFGISATEARAADPQHRLLLETAWEALEHAGLAPALLDGAPIGVFIGISSVDYWLLQARAGALGEGSPYSATGGAPSVAAGRIAYALGLTGPAIAVDTACSSALSALVLAAESLRLGNCAAALVGAVNLILSPETTAALCRMRALAPDGRTKAFDARADGYVRGEGCGILVLKPLDRAEADGDTVLARIVGWAMNQDGRTNGLAAPSGPAQRAVIATALARAGVGVDDVGFVEAHGTGTALGDVIEVGALAEVFAGRSTAAGPLLIGSVKAAIGHLEAAAGMAGILKVILMLRDEVIPAQPEFEVPSPKVRWSEIAVTVPTETVRWAGANRVAGVSAFGFSGTNVHVVLATAAQAAGRDDVATPELEAGERPVLILLSGRTAAALARRAAALARFLGDRPDLPLARVARAAAATRGLPFRAAVVAGRRAEALDALEAIGREAAGLPERARPVPADRVARVAGTVDPGAVDRLRTAFPVPFRSCTAAADPIAAFWDAVGVREAAAGGTAEIVLAVGRGPVDDGSGAVVVRALDGNADPASSVLEALAAVYRHGGDLDVGPLFPSDGRDVRLPPYPFERERFWFDHG